ncbi:MAG: Smr/MutS family protein [Acetanaerobacterium sp.]
MKITVINLEQGMPYVDEAIRRMNAGLRTARADGTRTVKLIHGYGSSGTGGRIRTAVERELAEKKRRGEIKEFVRGEEFTPFSDSCRKALDLVPDLQSDRDYLRCNQGITIVVLR